MTLCEVLMVLGALGLLAVLFVTWSSHSLARSIRLCCVNSLKQTGLAFNVWAGDNKGNFPMAISQTNGGTKEFTIGPNAYRHFQVVSNELSTPIVVVCPADVRYGRKATNFINFGNSNISFFIGTDANTTNPNLILAGDRNLTNGTPIRNGILELTTNNPAGWTAEMHKQVGNVVLSDASVQMVSIAGLRRAVENSGIVTNRLQIPILGL